MIPAQGTRLGPPAFRTHRRGAHGGPEHVDAVTVVIAACNAAAHIDAALCGVAAQVRPAAAVIVADDASTDGTAERAAAWADRLPLTVVRLDRNGGAGAARAAAMQFVGTPLVAFLDADDVWLPQHLALLVRTWRRRGGIVSPRAHVWDGERRLGDYHRSLGLRVPRRRQLERLFTANYVFSGSLFCRGDYERAGGMRALRLSEDWDLWARMAALGAPISCVSTPTVLYRRHGANASDDAVGMHAVRAHIGADIARGLPTRSRRRCQLALRRAEALARAQRGIAGLRHRRSAAWRDLAAVRRAGLAGVGQLLRRCTYLALRASGRRPLSRFTGA